MACEVTQLCLTPCDSMDCSLPGSSVHGIFPGKSTGVSCHFLLQGIFLTQGLSPDLLHCMQMLYCLSYQFSGSVMSNSLQPHRLQHSRLPCPSPTPRTYSNSCPSHWWCHPTVSSSVIPFSSCLQSFTASGSFPMSQFFTSGGQSIGVSALASVLPMNIQDWFPLGLTGWISLQFKWLSTKSLLQHHSSKASFLWHSAFFIVQLSHPYMTTGKTIALTRWTFVGKVMSLLFNTLSRLVIAFLPRSKHGWATREALKTYKTWNHKTPRRECRQNILWYKLYKCFLTLKALEIERKINKWDLIKLTSFYTAKEIINKMKRYLQNGRKYLQIMQPIRD